MVYTIEKRLRDFKFWGGAEKLANALTKREMNKVEEKLADFEFVGGIPSEEDVNDFFLYEGDTIALWLGYEDEEAIFKSWYE